MNWVYKNPPVVGNYVVQTKTKAGKINTMSANWTGKNWSFTNQLFYRYLKE
jgi:hypothetical protein